MDKPKLDVLKADGQFNTFHDWVANATGAIGGMNSLCFDARDRVCSCGGDFMRARDEGTFPIRYYHGAGDQTPRQQEKNRKLADKKLHPWRR